MRGGRISSLLASISLILALLAPYGVSAQAASGTLSGTIKSASGSPISNAAFTLKNKKNGQIVSLTSKKDGTYEIGNLETGEYTIDISATGFVAAHATVGLDPERVKLPTLSFMFRTRKPAHRL